MSDVNATHTKNTENACGARKRDQGTTSHVDSLTQEAERDVKADI